MISQKSSFSNDYINFLKDKITKSITHVVLTSMGGGTHTVDEFIKKENGELEYFVRGSVGNFNNIKIYSDDMLIESYDTVWISQGADAHIYHKINLFEGVQ